MTPSLLTKWLVLAYALETLLVSYVPADPLSKRTGKGPFAQGGLNEAFRLAVGFRHIEFGADLFNPQPLNSRFPHPLRFRRPQTPSEPCLLRKVPWQPPVHAHALPHHHRALRSHPRPAPGAQPLLSSARH